MALDKSLLLHRGRLSFRKYINEIKAHYSIKIDTKRDQGSWCYRCKIWNNIFVLTRSSLPKMNAGKLSADL